MRKQVKIVIAAPSKLPEVTEERIRVKRLEERESVEDGEEGEQDSV